MLRNIRSLPTAGLAGGNIEGGLEVRIQCIKQAVAKSPEEGNDSDWVKTLKLANSPEGNDTNIPNALGSRDCLSVKWTPIVMARSSTVVFLL